MSMNPGDALTHFDFSAIDEMDPALADPHATIVYDREVPVELRAHGGGQVGQLEAIHVKVVAHGEGLGLASVTAELTSESDLFFHRTHTMDARAFRRASDEQKLMVEFAEYPAVLVRQLDACVRQPHTHLAVLVLGPGGSGHLDFIQNLEYRFVELLSVAVDASPDEAVRQSVSFRYNALSARAALMHARLQDVSALIKLKSPGLLAQMGRSPSRYSPQHGGSPAPSRYGY